MQQPNSTVKGDKLPMASITLTEDDDDDDDDDDNTNCNLLSAQYPSASHDQGSTYVCKVVHQCNTPHPHPPKPDLLLHLRKQNVLTILPKHSSYRQKCPEIQLYDKKERWKWG